MADNLLTNKQTRLNHLDFYKGICILFVIITHHAWTPDQRKLLLFPFWIDMAVPVFMVITGYVNTMGFHQKRTKLKDAYHPREILGKWMRFLVPFTFVLVLQILAKVLMGQRVTPIGVIKAFIGSGGFGPGAYYFPIMLQVIMMFPLVWFVTSKYKGYGLIGCFLANILFELVKTAIRMPTPVYRLCALRYIFILAYGCYLFACREEIKCQKKKLYYASGVIGTAYLITFEYLSVDCVFVPSGWVSTFVIGTLYIVPVMLYLMKPSRLRCDIIELLGKASFDILLIQMAYYWGVADMIYKIVPGAALQLMISVILCCGAGVAFYKIESPITRRIVKAIRG